MKIAAQRMFDEIDVSLKEKKMTNPTPIFATQSLLDREKFIGGVWECACGKQFEELKKTRYLVLIKKIRERGK